MNLIDSQKQLIKWLVRKRQAGKLEEEFYVFWPTPNSAGKIAKMSSEEGEEVAPITKSVLQALAIEGLLICRPIKKGAINCTLTAKAFATVVDDFQETGTLATDLKDILLTLHKNLDDLRDREAKHADQASPELLNQINDHKIVIELTYRLLATAIDLQQELGSLNIADDLKARLISILGEK
jgi:hypothetical protein